MLFNHVNVWYSLHVMYVLSVVCFFFFFFKQKTAYEMRISDWSSDVGSSDLSKPLGIITVRSAGKPIASHWRTAARALKMIAAGVLESLAPMWRTARVRDRKSVV